jgi:hypothetical protein
MSTLTNYLAALAPKNSPALTGTPTAPTQALSDNSGAIATTAWVVAYVQSVIASSGGTITDPVTYMVAGYVAPGYVA